MTTLQQIKNASSDPRLQAFIGKKAIISLHQFYNGDPVKRDQDYGEMVGFEDGMVVCQTEEGRKRLPIQYEALVPAPRGKYTLKSTGEEIINPDFLISWRLDLADDLDESDWKANTAPHFASIVGKEWDFDYAYDEEYIREMIKLRGEDFIGKKIIIGVKKQVSLEDGTNKLEEQSQIYGEVMRVSFSEGVVIKLKDGSEFKLPPDVTMLQAARPAEYTLQSTQEVITNPDLITMWILTTAGEDSENPE